MAHASGLRQWLQKLYKPDRISSVIYLCEGIVRHRALLQFSLFLMGCRQSFLDENLHTAVTEARDCDPVDEIVEKSTSEKSIEAQADSALTINDINAIVSLYLGPQQDDFLPASTLSVITCLKNGTAMLEVAPEDGMGVSHVDVDGYYNSTERRLYEGT
jgi:hypothetical protein